MNFFASLPDSARALHRVAKARDPGPISETKCNPCCGTQRLQHMGKRQMQFHSRNYSRRDSRCVFSGLLAAPTIANRASGVFELIDEQYLFGQLVPLSVAPRRRLQIHIAFRRSRTVEPNGEDADSELLVCTRDSMSQGPIAADSAVGRTPAPPLFTTPSIHMMNEARQRLPISLFEILFFRIFPFLPEGADVLVAGHMTRVCRRFRRMVAIHRDARCGNDRFNDELRVILDALLSGERKPMK